jgi:hypothetical protein
MDDIVKSLINIIKINFSEEFNNNIFLSVKVGYI